MSNINKIFIDKVKDIVYGILNKENLLRGEWRLGKVDTVVSTTKLKVFIDGSIVSQLVPCNPSVTFNVGDEIWIICINNNPKDKFAISKRGI